MQNNYPDSGKRNIRLLIFSLSGLVVCFLAIAALSFVLQPDTPLRGMIKVAPAVTEEAAPQSTPQAAPVSAEPRTRSGAAPSGNPQPAETATQPSAGAQESGNKEDKIQDPSKGNTIPKDREGTPAENPSVSEMADPLEVPGQGS